MKYSRPNLMHFTSTVAGAFCEDGVGATLSEYCLDGVNVGVRCHIGSGVIGHSCTDGNSPGNKVCAVGNDAEFTGNRCYAGTGPTG